MKTPEKILFSDIFLRKDGKRVPLFKNKTVLASEIMASTENKEEGYDNLNTLKALLSQTMLFANKPGHRSLPEKLKELIVKVAVSKIADNDPHHSSFEQILENAFTVLKNEDFFPESVSSVSIERERFDASENATSHMIFTTRPAETFKSNKAENLKAELKQSLIERTKQYRFFFDKTDTAIKFWKSVEEEFQGEEIHLDELNRIQLKVYVINVLFCVHPLEIMNYEDEKKRVAYVLHLHGVEKGFSISKLSQYDLDIWYQNIYPLIIMDSESPYGKKEVTYSDYLKFINF